MKAKETSVMSGNKTILKGRQSASDRVKKITGLAMLTAVAYLTVFFFRLPIFGFLTMDFKDAVLVFGAFIFGPLAGFVMSAVLALVEMITISSTGIIGMIMNLLSSASFVCLASFIHKKKPGLKSAVIGLIAGCLAMTAVMLLWNYLITPLYMNATREQVAQMLIPTFLPFNLLKSVLNSSIAVMLYPSIRVLEKAKLISKRDIQKSGSKAVTIGIFIFTAIALITCVYFVLVLMKVI